MMLPLTTGEPNGHQQAAAKIQTFRRTSTRRHGEHTIIRCGEITKAGFKP
jgi:hypothetical protein